MREHDEAPYRRLPPARWELLAYALLLATAFALYALQYPRQVAVPLVIAVLGVRAVRIHLAKAHKGRVPRP